ncbi:unnamed protein product [Rotaria sp. Silwood1]|nr:unnamed protein product [Rotaria sp. Silwood1]
MLISLHHDQRASLAQTLQFVGLLLDLNDYDAYDLPKRNNFEQIYNNVNEIYLERLSCDPMACLKNFSLNPLYMA